MAIAIGSFHLGCFYIRTYRDLYRYTPVVSLHLDYLLSATRTSVLDIDILLRRLGRVHSGGIPHLWQEILHNRDVHSSIQFYKYDVSFLIRPLDLFLSHPKYASKTTMTSSKTLRIGYVPGKTFISVSPIAFPHTTTKTLPLTRSRAFLHSPPLRRRPLLPPMHPRPLPIRHRAHDHVPPSQRNRHRHRPHRRLGRRSRKIPSREERCGIQDGGHIR